MKNTKGFTLIEMIMVITLLGIIAAIIAIPLYQGARGWFAATTREGITQSGRIGIERMEREMRNTARTAANAPCISTAGGSQVVFSYLGGDLTTCDSIEFSLSGSIIQRITRVGGVVTETADLADNVSNLTFIYYDANNVSGASAANTRRISIEIESTKSGETMQKYSEVYLSNMRGY